MRNFFEGETWEFCSLSMRVGTSDPSQTVLRFFLRKTTSYVLEQRSIWHESCALTEMEPLQLDSRSRLCTAHENGNWERPQRA